MHRPETLDLLADPRRMQTRCLETIVTAAVFDEAIGDADVVDRQADTDFSERLGHRRTRAARNGIFFYGDEGRVTLRELA